MKRWSILAVSLALFVSLNGCSRAAPAEASQPDMTPEPEAIEQIESTPEPTPTPIPVLPYDPLTGGDTEYPGYRPVAISLLNTPAAWPVQGIADAEVLIEALASTGSTSSLMALYPNAVTLRQVGALGPCHDVMLQMVLSLNAVPVHNGTSVYASNLLNLLGYQDLDGHYVGTAVFEYDYNRRNAGWAPEYCWYTKASLVQAGLEKYQTSPEGELTPLFQFGDAVPGQIPAYLLNIAYSETSYTSAAYQPESGKYQLNHQSTEPWADGITGQPVTVDNVLLLYADCGRKDDGVTPNYDLSSGIGMLLNGGMAKEMLWQKGSATAPLQLYDTDGNELIVAPGKTYIGIYGRLPNQGAALYSSDFTPQPLP